MVKKRENEPAAAEVNISLDLYRQTRDSVIVSLSNVQKGLAHVQNGLNDLMTAYIKHTASVLAGEDGTLESLQLPSDIAETANNAMAAATFAINNVAHAVAPGAKETATGKNNKRKREKKEKDPNAPKRPLTAAFLFIQAARPVVKKDLEAELAPGQKLEPNAVNIEVNKRWNEMAEPDKEAWKASYRESLKKYQEDMSEYNANKDAAAEELLHIEEEASDEGEGLALDSEAESESEDEAAVASPLTKAPTPPAKTPRANKRQKTAATPQVNGSAPVAIAPAASAPTPVPVPSSRQVTQVLPPASSIEVVAPTPAKKDKKKSKAAPQPIAPAPAPVEEASPDETKKRSKSSRTTRNAEVETESQEKENKPAKKRDRSKKKSEASAA